jgi:hypothetical protein
MGGNGHWIKEKKKLELPKITNAHWKHNGVAQTSAFPCDFFFPFPDLTGDICILEL